MVWGGWASSPQIPGTEERLYPLSYHPATHNLCTVHCPVEKVFKLHFYRAPSECHTKFWVEGDIRAAKRGSSRSRAMAEHPGETPAARGPWGAARPVRRRRTHRAPAAEPRPLQGRARASPPPACPRAGDQVTSAGSDRLPARLRRTRMFAGAPSPALGPGSDRCCPGTALRDAEGSANRPVFSTAPQCCSSWAEMPLKDARRGAKGPQ